MNAGNSPATASVCGSFGSAAGVHAGYLNTAFAMGQALAQAGLRLVSGAGKTGLMLFALPGGLERWISRSV